MQVDPIIEPLLRSSRLPVYLDELTAFYARERKKREAFYESLTEEIKAEFIDGEIVIHSPAKNRHIETKGLLFRLMSLYVDLHHLGSVKMEKALVKLSRNDFEPDICFFRKATAETFQKATMFFPAPDLVVEVLSDSTENRDQGVKFEDYALHGVGEYWIVDAETETIEQYFLAGTAYKLHVKVKDGTITSEVIDGFILPVDAAFHTEKNLRVLQNLLAK